MVTVTTAAFREKVAIDSKEILLIGPPGSLQGNMQLSNRDAEKLFVRELALVSNKKGHAIPNLPASIRLITSLKPGESKTQGVRLSAPATTPPGEYECSIDAGGKKRKVRMLVQPHIAIDIHPLRLYFQGVVSGQRYSAELSLTNQGNLPFRVPDIKHGTVMDYDYLCRATSIAIRGKGAEGFLPMMDEVTRNIHNEMAGWALLSLQESGKEVAPGATLQLHFTITLPKDVDPRKDYSGNVRIWNKVLEYHIKSY